MIWKYNFLCFISYKVRCRTFDWYIYIQCTVWILCFLWLYGVRMLIVCTDYLWYVQYNVLDIGIQCAGYKNTIYWIQKYNILDTVTQYIFWHGCWVNFLSNDSPTKTTQIDAKPHFGEMLTVQWYLQLSSLLCRDDLQGYLESSDTTVVNFYCILPIFIILWS